MSKIIKACLDKWVSPELEATAKRLAVAENPANAPRPATPFEMAVETQYLWRPGSVVSVRFLHGHPQVCQKVQYFAHIWEQFANIKFDFVKAGEAKIRIAFAQGDGSWSYLGTQALVISDQDVPTMNFGWLEPDTDDTEYSRVVLHEFGHALGGIHEHQHPENGVPWDKEKAYTYYGQQGWTRQDVDFQVFQKYSVSTTQFSKFDTHSIMMYPIPEEITTGNYSVGWNMGLSDTDKAFIGKLYPFS